MIRIPLLVAIAASLVAPPVAADAATSKKHRHHHQQRAEHAPVYQDYGPWTAPVAVRRRGPPWAMPNECFNDEGYGRWSPCGGRDR